MTRMDGAEEEVDLPRMEGRYTAGGEGICRSHTGNGTHSAL